MVYAQFFCDSTGWNGKDFSGPVKLVPLCGSDGVFHLDGRKTLDNQKLDAEKRIKSLNLSLKLNVKGFQIMRGQKYTTARPLTTLTPA